MHDGPGRTSDLWAITSYFDPRSTRHRLANYRSFRQNLGVPLLAVELVHGEAPQLGADDADILVQIRGGDVLWQKERLLNLALARLPESCTKVAWIDCDVIFGAPDWPAALGAALESHALVQPYAAVHLLPPTPEAEATRQISIASVLASGVPPATCLVPDPTRGGPGYAFGHAWAARREVLDGLGLYDACIVGGGDRALICAAEGCFDPVMDLQHMSASHRRHYLAWAEPFAARVAGAMTFLAGDIVHLWHGTVESRAYHARHAGLAPFAFDPFEDVALAPSGAWCWKAHKPALWAYVGDYFAGRDAGALRDAAS